MGCPQNESELLLLALGELSGRQRRQLEEHLATCATCQTRQRELSAASALFQESFTPPGQSLPRSGPTFPWLATLIVAFVLLSAIVLRLFVGGGSTRPPIDDGCPPGLHSDRCR